MPLWNEFTTKFRRWAERGYLRTRILSAETGVVRSAPVYGIKADSRVTGSASCRLSQERYGIRPRPVLEAPWLFDDPTAAAMQRQWALAYAHPRDAIDVVGPLTLERYSPGDIVLVSHDQSYWTDEPALVYSRDDSLRQVALTLVLVTPPALRARRTS